MREALAIFLSTVAAAAAPAAILALYVFSLLPGRPGAVFVTFCMSFMLAFAHAMILGLPASLALVHKRAFRALSMLIAGGIVGLMPAGLMFFPYSAPRDWLSYLTLVGAAFGLGVSGGIAFYVTYRIILAHSRRRHFAARLKSGAMPVIHTPSSIEMDRPLASDELAVIRWLLEHGDGDNSRFIEQLDHARVARLCGCGCASIDLSINGKRPARSTMRVLSDYQWHNNLGHLCGAFVFEQDGLLAGLDLWSIDGRSTPDAMPPIESLVPCGTPPQA